MVDNPKWEEVTEDMFPTFKLKVEGGWLYKTPGTLVFVPEPVSYAKPRSQIGGEAAQTLARARVESVDDWVRHPEQVRVRRTQKGYEFHD